MGRYLNTNSCASSVGRSYCRIRYLLRKHPRLTKAPPGLDLHSYSLFPCTSTSAQISVNDRDRGANLLRDFTKHVTRLHNVRFYSSSNRNVFKAEAPIGILEETQNKSQANSLGERLGQSFVRLSTHINLYFQQKDAAPLVENAPRVVTTPDHFGRSQRRCQSQRPARERNKPHSKDSSQTPEDKQERCSAAIQLFHISSLATRFGESYTYVANHINSVFSVASEKVEPPTKTAPGRPKRRQTRNSFLINSELDAIVQEESNTDQTVMEPHNTSSSCRHFARHVNKYFAAMVADDLSPRNMRGSTNRNHFSTQDTLQVQGGTSQLKPQPDSGLFHNSNMTTFGENHSQTSRHINRYFGLDEDRSRSVSGSGTAEEPRTVSFIDCLRYPASAIPDWVGSYLKWGPSSQTSESKASVTPPETIWNKRRVMNWRQSEEVTRGLILSLGQAPSPEALTASVEALNEHLICYPSHKALMWQGKTVVTLLKRRRAHRDKQQLQGAIRETLALIGYVDPVKGRGIRVLSIDGGGTRGVVPLQVLKLLEAETGKKIHQLFDYICGVSTGAVLAFMLGLAHFSLEECADMYRRFGSEVFRQNPLVGTMKMGWSHSYYNTETWETILQEKLGDRVLIKTARDELSPKVSAVSAVVNWGTSPKAFVFCNYNHKPGSLSRYAGACGYQMWQAVRASSAAPGYFQEFPLQSDIHQDGGIIMNNPCALAVHESRLLWPKHPFQCVLSLGTGRYDNAKRAPATSTSLRAKISNLICSATDTEGVHTLLDDLLAPDVYFRFNPMLSSEVSLDESRPGALDQLERDTQIYLERNRPKLARLCLVLGAERSAVSRTSDWISGRVWEMKQGWV